MSLMSAVIPSRNGLELLRRHLGGMLRELGGVRLVVVDDGSSDGTSAEGPGLFPDVEFIRRDGPPGFCHAVNLGFSKAGGDLVLLLNNDISPCPGAFDALRSTLDDGGPDAWVAVPEVRRAGFGDEGLMRVSFRHGLARTSAQGRGCPYPCGGCALFRRASWEELGGLDTRFAPVYWEDADLGSRAAARGWRIVRSTGPGVLHHHASTMGTTLSSERLRERNRFVYMSIHHSSMRDRIETMLWLPLHAASAAVHGRREFMLGLIDFLKWRSAGGGGRADG